ncbi:MAG: hypothetical protein NT170_02815 [Candidatus Moranbacteria bacterium]|nr:hypothetical protein [Candidatus Moranbacteria bacterium]
MGLENPTFNKNSGLPGGPLPEWQLYQPKMRKNEQGQLAEIGATTPTGEFYNFQDGESLSLDREGAKRVPYIKMVSGDKVSFDTWRKARVEKFQSLLEKVDPDYRAVYIQVLQDFPELDQIEIKAGDRKKDKTLEKTDGYFKEPADLQSSAQVVMDMEKDDEKYQKLIQDRKSSVEMCANMLGISPEDIINNPRILKLFIFLHELGHGHEYINYFQKKMLADKNFDPIAQWNERSNKELMILPVPGCTPPRVLEMHNAGELRGYYQKYNEHYRSVGINSPEELIVAQDIAYRKLPKENYADNFAKSFLLKYWGKFNL